MADHRATILEGLRGRLLDIKVQAGYNYDIQGVELLWQDPTERNESDFPLIFIEPGPEREEGETLGKQTDGRYHMAFEMMLLAYAWADGDVEERRVAGERLIHDIRKRLTLAKDLGLDLTVVSGSFTLDETLPPDPFELVQTSLIFVRKTITFRYGFKPSTL